ncbi:MAG: hypothetical protein DRR16_28930 [Candidatus Parabeggiatoa sp. nov. 3]|nr:MAG: hypothetical protein DRR00_17295 [Gammaproteobacteria bacterium]RKZ65251.1 MAG: hypothetical protein DRQ99_13280 [Gammaproteobacteria bacterium]RKZ77816.1 MAG: hypothetical protein DRR16_28930 [Gammaproteobacteria bacterium]
MLNIPKKKRLFASLGIILMTILGFAIIILRHVFDFTILFWLAFIIFNVSLIVAIGWFAARYVARKRSKCFSKLVKIDTDIKTFLEKSLSLATNNQHRLSQVEIASVNAQFKKEVHKEVKNNLERITYEVLLFYLFLFFMLGIVLLTLIILFLDKIRV